MCIEHIEPDRELLVCRIEEHDVRQPRLRHEREHFVIGTDGLVKSLDDLRNVVIGATPQGVPITVATVGDVRFGPRLRRGAATKDGEGEVVVGVALMLIQTPWRSGCPSAVRGDVQRPCSA